MEELESLCTVGRNIKWSEFQFCNMKRGVEIMEVTVQQFELSTATRWTVLLKMGKMVNFVMCILSKFFK